MEKSGSVGKGSSIKRTDGIYRRYQRRELSNYTVDIADGRRVIGGDVENVSVNGFKITGVSNAFESQNYMYKVLVSGNGNHFKLQARPCWEKKGVGTKEIGFKVVDATWEWYQFVLEAFEKEDAH